MPTAVRTDLRPQAVRHAAGVTPARPTQSRPSAPPLQLVPEQPQQSRKLALLLTLRRISTPTAIVMVLSILPLYGWIVSTQLSWGKRYQQLDQLRREERQFQTLTENLKHDLTQNAMEHPSGLVPQGPNNNLFLPEMPSRLSVPKAATLPVQPKSAISAPLAY